MSTLSGIRYETEGINPFPLLGAGVNPDSLDRPIPSVRVIPTRRAYIRRIRPEGPQNLSPDDLGDEYNFRTNPQNFPPNMPNFFNDHQKECEMKILESPEMHLSVTWVFHNQKCPE
ncbi:hypothetical protein CEXT_175911 [Caerostris extrusa]|uniref:Uncharacterized protein n=1 Tax=Caerostris extrusa TaxID=172846 RepID=A0AAV4NPI2_CAEEX|nr:hypothetical protein CEXT_175911 [Caerostris extrusa]